MEKIGPKIIYLDEVTRERIARSPKEQGNAFAGKLEYLRQKDRPLTELWEAIWHRRGNFERKNLSG